MTATPSLITETAARAPAVLFVAGWSHRSADLAWRERHTLDRAALERLQATLRAHPHVSEVLVLATCGRLEVYGCGAVEAGHSALVDALERQTGTPAVELRRHLYSHTGVAALRHLFGVASGLDSELVGETEILGQLKQAYGNARDGQGLGPQLHRCFQKTFQTAKLVRNETGIATGAVSLGNIAVDLAQRISGRLRDCGLLVIGSGGVGRDVAQAFHSRGVARLEVTSRTSQRAETLAAEVGGTSLPFEGWTEALTRVDIAVFCTAAPGHLLGTEGLRARLKGRETRPLFVIDLAVPRDVESSAAALDNVFLYTFEDLTRIANENRRAREAEVDRARVLLEARAARLWRQHSRCPTQPPAHLKSA